MSTPKLSSDQVTKVAKLARVSKQLSSQELEKYEAELNSILNHVSELNKVDVSTIQPFAGIRTINIDNLRKDEPTLDQTAYQTVRNNIINNFPEKQGNFLVISGIFQ